MKFPVENKNLTYGGSPSFFVSKGKPEVYGQCPSCNGDIQQGSTSCPDNKIGCLVCHFGYGCKDCLKVFDFQELSPGQVYHASEPENFGSFPIRSELTVFPADDPNQLKLGWAVYELNGGKVYLESDPKTNLSSLDSIKVGDKVLVGTLIGTVLMTISEINGNEACAETEFSIAPMEFGKDSRNCWTSPILINKKCLNKLSILSIEKDK